MLRPRSVLFVVLLGLLVATPFPASAQSVDSVVDNMKARYQQQLEAVDTYIVETNLYTSYNKKTSDGTSYDSRTKMKSDKGSSFASSTTPSAAYGLQLDRLKQHATYGGTETVNDTETHILKVDEPSKVNPDMKKGDAESMTYYIDGERHIPTRLLLNTKGQGGQGPKTSSITVNLLNYQTVDGLTLPYRMEFQFNMDMTEQEKKQMAMVIQKLDNMPEQDSDKMKNMMGNQVEMMKKMLSGDPIVVEVENVKVNAEIPSGVF